MLTQTDELNLAGTLLCNSRMINVGDDILLGIQELICAEAFPTISTHGVPKLKQQEHQWFSNDQKRARVQHFQQTWEIDSSPISMHASHPPCANTV